MTTAAGVDFLEENYAKIPLLRRLLGSGPEFGSQEPAKKSRKREPLVLPPPSEPSEDDEDGDFQSREDRINPGLSTNSQFDPRLL